MPSGLVQTVLCDENVAIKYSRLDELFYYTMKAILNRLNCSLEVEATVDNGRALVTRKVDYNRMENWRVRLESSLKVLDILFDSNRHLDRVFILESPN